MFSIIIPHFNRYPSLIELLASIRQDFDRVDEVIIVDNNSEGCVREQLNALCADEKIIILDCDVPGANACRNMGANYASSEWLVFCDDDDRFLNDKPSTLSRYISDNPSVEVIINSAFISLNGSKYGYESTPMKVCGEIAFDQFVTNKFGSTSCLTIKRSVLLDVGAFDENLGSLQDYELYVRLVSRSANIMTVEDVLTWYFKSLGKKISNSEERFEKSIQYIEKKHEVLFGQLGKQEKGVYDKWVVFLRISKCISSHKFFQSFKYFHIRNSLVYVKLIVSYFLLKILK